MSHEAISTRFDEWAESGRGDEMEKGHGDVVRQVLAELTIRPGYQILDLGCGVGWATRLLAESAPGVQAIGIDASPRMIARAEELSSLRIRARYEVGTFEHLDFGDGKFDLVFSMEALYYAVDLERALAEIRRVTKAGGELHAVIDYYEGRPSTEGWRAATGLRLQRLSEDEWQRALERAGFAVVETRRVCDSRGAGEAADFQAGACFPDWDAFVKFHAAGSLWIRAQS